MGWKQWTMVAVVIGGGILLQIPGHDDMDMADRSTVARTGAGSMTDALPEGMTDMPAPYTTVALDVTGMT
ncbi:MAG: hypothetical protein HKN71_00590 [Gemmatimonadetes bacterium]|nr:hypothetical protein [Gemmatimonadota bacterium]